MPVPEDRRQGRGRLFVVASPIGNLGDLSPRAREVLAEADLIAAEDTRRSGRLLAHLGLDRPLTSCHRFNEARSIERFLRELGRSKTLVLISDGGTPAISDPGYRLVAAAAEAGYEVIPIPGPCAAAAALSVAGFPAERFTFRGFLPSRRTARRKEIRKLEQITETVVLYEAPHRVLECLEDLAEEFPSRPMVLCRELTKLHEELLRGSTMEITEKLAGREKILGEIVIVLGPVPRHHASDAPRVSKLDRASREALERRFREALEREGGDEKRALRLLSRELALPRAEVKSLLQRQRPTEPEPSGDD